MHTIWQSNEHHAHYLLLDPEYQLEDFGTGVHLEPAYICVVEHFRKAVLEEIQKSTPDYTRIFRILAEIKSGIVDNSSPRLQEEINRVIDIDFLQSLLSAKAWEWSDACNFGKANFGVILLIRPRQSL